MTCKFQITIPAGSINLTSPMDWWEVRAAILQVMGIKDAGPVASQAQAEAIAATAVRRHQAAPSGAAMPAKRGR